MALELLRRIAAQPLPCTVEGGNDIALLRALRAAGFIEAHIPQALRFGGRPLQPVATVQLVTLAGWSALALAAPQMPQRSSAAPSARQQAAH